MLRVPHLNGLPQYPPSPHTALRYSTPPLTPLCHHCTPLLPLGQRPPSLLPLQNFTQVLLPPHCQRVYSILLRYPLWLRSKFSSLATILAVKLHWPPLEDACLITPDLDQRPRRLRARPLTYADDSTWERGGHGAYQTETTTPLIILNLFD